MGVKSPLAHQGCAYPRIPVGALDSVNDHGSSNSWDGRNRTSRGRVDRSTGGITGAAQGAVICGELESNSHHGGGTGHPLPNNVRNRTVRLRLDSCRCGARNWRGRFRVLANGALFACEGRGASAVRGRHNAHVDVVCIGRSVRGRCCPDVRGSNPRSAPSQIISKSLIPPGVFCFSDGYLSLPVLVTPPDKFLPHLVTLIIVLAPLGAALWLVLKTTKTPASS